MGKKNLRLSSDFGIGHQVNMDWTKEIEKKKTLRIRICLFCLFYYLNQNDYSLSAAV